MSIKRVSSEQFRSEILPNMRYLTDAVIVVNFGSTLANFPFLVRSLSLDSLREISRGSSDTVGFVSEGSASELLLEEAVNKLSLGVPGYINGWEYVAGDCGFELLGDPVSSIDEFFIEENFLLSLNINSATMLDSVMKWVFISQGSGSYSDWHIDPVGSAVWMLMITGEKIWHVENEEGKIFPGDLIIIPPGKIHKVVNVNEGLNVAISHNWVPKHNTNRMWTELARGLRELENFSSPDSPNSPSDNLLVDFQNTHPTIDNLLFGLMMIFLYMEKGKQENVVEVFCVHEILKAEINSLLDKLVSRIS